jgi:hypothetical protein
MNKLITIPAIVAMLLLIATPIKSKAITINDISTVARNTDILPPEIKQIATIVTGLFNSPQNSTISPALINNVMTSFGVSGGMNGLTLGGSSNGNQPLSISNLMDFAGLSQLDKVGLPKNSDGLTAGNTDSLLSALTANYSAASASASKTQVDDSAKVVSETASSVSTVINSDEIDPQSSLEMLRKMGQELQANGQMLQSSAAVQVAQAKIDANRYNLEAANVQQQSYKDFQEKRYIENASLASARLQERLLDRSFGSATSATTAPSTATPTIASSSIFGP